MLMQKFRTRFDSYGIIAQDQHGRPVLFTQTAARIGHCGYSETSPLIHLAPPSQSCCHCTRDVSTRRDVFPAY
jgi:hypothetical protein